MAQNGSLYGVLAGFFASMIGTFACGSMVSDKAAHDRPDGSSVGGNAGVGKGGDNGAAAFTGSAGTGGFPGPSPGYGCECLGSGKYRCEGGVVTHELRSGGYPEGTQCTQTILRCEYGCLADGLASDGPPEALCERAIAASSEGGGACPNVPGEGGRPRAFATFELRRRNVRVPLRADARTARLDPRPGLAAGLRGDALPLHLRAERAALWCVRRGGRGLRCIRVRPVRLRAGRVPRYVLGRLGVPVHGGRVGLPGHGSFGSVVLSVR